MIKSILIEEEDQQKLKIKSATTGLSIKEIISYLINHYIDKISNETIEKPIEKEKVDIFEL